MEFFARVGKAEGLSKLLSSSVESGLNADPQAAGDDSVLEHRRVFGENKHAETPPKNVSTWPSTSLTSATSGRAAWKSVNFKAGDVSLGLAGWATCCFC